MNTTRRNYLRGSAAAVCGLGTVATADAHGNAGNGNSSWDGDRDGDTFEVAVFTTDGVQALFDGPTDAARRAKAWIEGAFDHPDNPHEVSVTVGDVSPTTPDEEVFGERSGTGPCGREQRWNNLVHWWKSYHTADCTDLTTAADSHLLLSAGDGGGYAFPGGRYAVAGSGTAALWAGEYRRFGYEHRHCRMKTILHELGHNLIREPFPDGDGDGNEGQHDMAAIKRDPDGWLGLSPRYAVTPMGVAEDRNNCGSNDHPKSAADDPWWFGDTDDKPDGWAMFYSECAVRHFRPAGE
jgi:hypothetical protein